MTDDRGDAPAILFLCLGNICRSPLAEGVARAAFADAGIAVRLDLRGLATGMSATRPTPARRRRRGGMTSISAICARANSCAATFTASI